MKTREENIERFESLMAKVTREGKDDLMEYIRNKTDFYSAPASTKFHLSCEGGLLQHSLNVYDCLQEKKNSFLWAHVFEGVSEESLIIMALLHDLCKVRTYVKGTRNVKTYDVEKVNKAEGYQVKRDGLGSYIWETVLTYETEDIMPLGHGEKSVILIQHFMKLRTQELFAIRWHMGFSDIESKTQRNLLGSAMEKYPIILALFEADMEAAKLLEDETGNKEY